MVVLLFQIAAALCLIAGSTTSAAQTPPPSRSLALERLAQAAEIIKRAYIEPVDDGRLAAGCREGMLDVVDSSKRPDLAQAGASRSVVGQFLDLAESITKRDPENSDEKKLVAACLTGLLRGLDRHSAYLNEEEFRELQVGSAPVGGLGIELKIEAGVPVIVAPIEGGPAARAGLAPGDIVTAIDAESTRGQALPVIVKRLRGPVGSGVTVTVVREGSPEPRNYALTREAIRIQSVRWKSLLPGYAYIRIVQFQEITGPLVAQAIEGAYRENQGDLKGLVLDLRGNTGGLLNVCVAVAAAFLPSGAVIVYTDGRSEDSKMRLTASPENYLRGRKQLDFLAKLPSGVKTVPIAMLVDGATASGSELVASALRDHGRARILGARTFDLGTVTTIFPLAGNTALKLTTARLFAPSGKAVAPVMPDVVLEKSNVPATAYGSADDVQLTQAIKMLGGLP